MSSSTRTRDVGLAQASSFKNDAIPFLLSGALDFDSVGALKGIHGDLPFVDFWQHRITNDVGFFGIQLPPNPVTNSETWDIVVPIKDTGGVQFEGDTLSYTNTFTFVEEDANIDPYVATFKLRAPLRRYDLGAYMEQGGQRSHADLSNFEIRTVGTIHFDKRRHVIMDEDVSNTAHLTIAVLIQGRAISGQIELDAETVINLVPPGSSDDSDSEKPAGHKAL